MTAGSLTGEGEVEQVQGDIVGYDGQSNFSEYGPSGGSKRRKRGKRNSRKIC